MKETTKFCSECRNGEIPDEPAVAKVRHPNDDTWGPAPPITKWVCSGHLSMLQYDYGDDLKIIQRISPERATSIPEA